MKKRKNRIKLWAILIGFLLLVVAYLYLDRQSVTAPDFLSESSSRANTLVYLKESDNAPYLYDLETDQSHQLEFVSKLGNLLFLQPGSEPNQALLLINTTDGPALYNIDLKQQTSELIGKVVVTNPVKAYRKQNGDYLIIYGNDSRNLALFDHELAKISEYEHPTKITEICSAGNDRFVDFADFDGQNSTINRLDYSGEKAKLINDLAKSDRFSGEIFQFDDQVALYTKKIEDQVSNDESPLGKTYWKITLFNRSDDTESIISEGNFDQNAIYDPSLELIAYQKKFDVNDQTDGRIFISSMGDISDRLEVGRPLLFINLD
jgi:hypothetical protein